MKNIFVELIPIALMFFVGYVFRKTGILKTEDGDLFLRLIFFLSLPALILSSITNIELSKDFAFIPFVAMWIILTTFFVSFFIGKLFFDKGKSLGTFLVGSMTMEVSFIIPFVLPVYGNEGIARLALFDLGSSLLVFSFVYLIACNHGTNSNNSREILLKKVFLSPPILAALTALTLNLLNFQMPQIAESFLKNAGDLTVPLIMLSVGIYFNLKFDNILPLFSAVFIRMFIGLFMGFVFVNLFNLDGFTKEIILIASASPICYNTLTFSSLENLDKEFAANLISLSILVGFLLIPLLLFILN